MSIYLSFLDHSPLVSDRTLYFLWYGVHIRVIVLVVNGILVHILRTLVRRLMFRTGPSETLGLSSLTVIGYFVWTLADPLRVRWSTL